MSWVRSESSSSCPSVGRFSTMEMIASPAISVGSSRPTVLTNGLRAMRSGYFSTRVSGFTPLARAVTT